MINVEVSARSQSSRFRDDLAVLLAIAAMVALVHLLTNGRYGFHRDELQTLSDARHMDWGFVAYPPVTPGTVIVDANRNLYGTAAYGGTYECSGRGCGVVWEITP